MDARVTRTGTGDGRLRRSRAVLASLALSLAAGLLAGPPALAHEERESFAPEHESTVPTYRTLDEAAEVLVVCKPDSRERIEAMADPEVRATNLALLDRCGFDHIQAAVEAVTVQRTNIYVLPGLYLEEPSREAACARGYDGGVVTYEDGYACPTMVNLVGIFGDSPDDDDRECDNARCHLQLEGTGETAEDVILRGGFGEDGDWIDQHNGIKADRADGIYIANLTAELVRENAIYVHETNGFVIDGTITRHNDLYGILTFLSDHGLISDCEASHNGDGGIYPGSPPDIYADDDFTGPLPRPVTEITRCRSHHNALGHSASAGNGLYLHDNDFHDNLAGIVVDSFVPDHPGMPVDHNWFAGNRVYSNNANFYEEFVDSGICDLPPAERGYEDGTVCPAFPLPAGTGILVAGGNHNLIEDNDIYDNWRNGIMLFWVPAAVREDFDPTLQYDTSHHNHILGNRFGTSPEGLRQPNGVDQWWDDQGTGNCWQGNTGLDGAITTNAIYPGGLPDCDSGGSVWEPGNPVKSAQLAPCATYDREDNPRPPGCDWMDRPDEPEGRETSASGDTGSDGDAGDPPAAAPAPERSLPATGGGLAAALLGLGVLAVAARVRPGGRGPGR
ncbi:MAG: right-handed parallel beta-helix repeat-containing protein [Actinobacteria bacterium]|nr:right-handed parallel beta-helix repeat-containing protein [Actinomycetota bacterium]